MVTAVAPSTQSPKRSFSSISSNPRRSHPSQSKSLPKSKRVKIDDTSNGSSEERSASQVSVNAVSKLPIGGSRDSSSDQSAAKWFDRVNENVQPSHNKYGRAEVESPFYMAHQSSYPGVPVQSHTEEAFGQRASDDTERDELRGVIDDLTVENKRLKHILNNRQSQSSPSSTSGPDRIIEVRMHGLPAEKKRELEQLLKSFATGLNGETPSSALAPVEKSLSSIAPSAPPRLKAELTANTDSGYASISGSGLNSSHGTAMLREPVSRSKRDKDIKDYLHDIPDSLFPQDTLSVSESARMIMVVQRLEQLFMGNLAQPGEHSLPVQQQQISRAAAKADRAENRRQNRARKVEGSREARRRPAESKLNLDAVEHERQTLAQKQDHTNESSSSSATPRSAHDGLGSPDQRPTRPLDLDIHRAQTAVDNVQYLRHLGFSSPAFDESPEGKQQPWMYLNLLISMAQLHTLNVTPAFVRKAVKQLSTKFELSKDGHKIRWKGGPTEDDSPDIEATPESAGQRASEATPNLSGRQSGRGSITSTLNDPPSMSISDHQRHHEKPTTTTSKLVTQSTTTSSQPAINPSSGSKSPTFGYKPVVFKGKKSRLRAGNSYLDSSSFYDDSAESSGLTHAMSRSSLRSKEDAREGLITFFSNPYFCTDLSGDRSPINMRSIDSEDEREVLGIAKQQQSQEEVIRDSSTCYYTAKVDEFVRSWPAICSDVKMDFPPIDAAGEDETQPMELDASGIGGVRPEDNFALDVQVGRNRTRNAHTEERRLGRGPAKYNYRTTACRKLSLQPSRLPPPSYVFFTSGSSSSAGQDHFYGDENSEASEEEESPLPAGLLWQWSTSSNERQMADDDNSEASSSLGVLEAARARFVNPGDVIPQDRDYILGQSGRTHMSGSLAATVGASWSVKSVAEPEPAREEDESSSSDVSVDED
ncbi:frequency clock protein [Exophiala viscosa]|uniref:Frequency clock protein n=1 Tax=Exophiala viscosa TaxID=2486360 RepID=A0AAN6DLK0_9EURO|nr:frequency clock protein [Exophiala viscosa]KAI1619735.1 frequency clock protein [Exophiala viscosa]